MTGDGMIRVRDLKKNYRSGHVVVQALAGVDFEVREGEFTVVAGPSGCGKSTLLYILGGLLRATSGSAVIDGFEVTGAPDSRLTSFRRDNIGFVFQKFNLISALSVRENLRIACRIQGRLDGAAGRIDETLERVGLAHKGSFKPLDLSQGEQQRVAVARALIKEPKILLADEPTGNLDSANSRNIMELFRGMSSGQGQTILMITHNRELAALADRIIEMQDGRVIGRGGEDA
jgi:putative ABC transport system ATP-binding protein